MKYPFTALTMLGLLAGSIGPAYANNSNVESALAGQSDLSMFTRRL